MQSYAEAITILKMGGGLCVLWLAYKSARSAMTAQRLEWDEATRIRSRVTAEAR